METRSTSGILSNPDGIINKATSGAHAAVNSIAEVADRAASKANANIDRAAAIADRAVDKTAAAAERTVDWLAAQGETVSVGGKKAFANTRDYVSANPLKALGIAAVVGILVSRLFLR